MLKDLALLHGALRVTFLELSNSEVSPSPVFFYEEKLICKNRIKNYTHCLN
jgi:hypothetical protein